MILDKMESAGFTLEVTDSSKLRVVGTLDENQRDYVRIHKQQIIVALRLRPLAEKHGHDLADLMVWYKNDIEDLAVKSDSDLEFIVNDYTRNQGIYRYFKPVPHCVKCIDCKHFTRSDHPHLGKCDAGMNQSAPAGFWDSHLRGCDKYIEAIE